MLRYPCSGLVSNFNYMCKANRTLKRRQFFVQGNDEDEEMFWDYPKAGRAGAATTAAAGKANGAAQKPNGVQAADGAFGTTMSPEFKVRLPCTHFALLITACWRLIAHARPACCMVGDRGPALLCLQPEEGYSTSWYSLL